MCSCVDVMSFCGNRNRRVECNAAQFHYMTLCYISVVAVVWQSHSIFVVGCAIIIFTSLDCGYAPMYVIADQMSPWVCGVHSVEQHLTAAQYFVHSEQPLCWCLCCVWEDRRRRHQQTKWAWVYEAWAQGMCILHALCCVWGVCGSVWGVDCLFVQWWWWWKLRGLISLQNSPSPSALQGFFANLVGLSNESNYSA